VKPKFRIVPIAQLVLDDTHANKGTKRGRDLLKKSLGRETGRVNAVVAACSDWNESRERPSSIQG
jgi:hypothetical protein